MALWSKYLLTDTFIIRIPCKNFNFILTKNRGIIYIAGRDKMYRPSIVV